MKNRIPFCNISISTRLDQGWFLLCHGMSSFAFDGRLCLSTSFVICVNKLPQFCSTVNIA